MKLPLLVLSWVSFSFASDAFTPDRGLYHCKKGNEESICDQLLIPKVTQTGDLDAISVEYVGWCGSMGPYLYSCSSENGITQCSDGFSDGIQFDFLDTKTYRWENKEYGFVCDEMVKTDSK